MPIRVIFELTVFQNGEVDEVVTTEVHEFDHEGYLTNAMLSFTAKNSDLRVTTAARALSDRKGEPRIREPKIKQGLGNNTSMVITHVTFLDGKFSR